MLRLPTQVSLCMSERWFGVASVEYGVVSVTGLQCLRRMFTHGWCSRPAYVEPRCIRAGQHFIL